VSTSFAAFGSARQPVGTAAGQREGEYGAGPAMFVLKNIVENEAEARATSAK
jgi:hypothetical protein